MTLFVVIAIVLLVGAAIYFVMSRGSGGNAVAVPADASSPFADEGEARLIERDPAITWPTLFDPGSTNLDDATRLRLINDLALVRAPWCVPILRRACEEEREPALRQAAHDAVAACESGAASAH